jgi:hypothetical protein
LKRYFNNSKADESENTLPSNVCFKTEKPTYIALWSYPKGSVRAIAVRIQ